ncbi:MAG: hypothetical protein ACOY4R_10155 [Pseudomonadota bacterium]
MTPSDRPDFSLMVGGPLYQLFARSRLLQPPLGLLQRRVLALTAFAWLPLLLLAAIDGRLLPGKDYVPFLYDIEGHVRLLVVLPLLLAAELPVHQRLRSTIRQFVERNLVPVDERPKFDAAVATAMRRRNSVGLEAAILLLAVTAGHWLWRSQIAFEGSSWYAISTGTGLELTLPGYWYGIVAIPLFQFVGFRWYMRLAIWAWLLWRISRLRINLVPTHADRAAGLGFVGNSSYAFSLLLLAHGALLSGWIADRVLLGGSNALDFQVEAFVLICCVVALIVAPLCVFAGPLAAAKRRGRGEYGRLVSQYTQAFDRKWVHGERPKDEPMLGSGDMQSLADLSTAYEIVQEMRLVPFGLKLVTRLGIITAVPLLPLAFTILPFRSMIMQAIKIVL